MGAVVFKPHEIQVQPLGTSADDSYSTWGVGGRRTASPRLQGKGTLKEGESQPDSPSPAWKNCTA